MKITNIDLHRFINTVVLSAVFLITATCSSQPEKWTVTSPNGELSISLEITDQDSNGVYSRGRSLYYSVTLGTGTNLREVLLTSPLGIVRDDMAFVSGMDFDSATEHRIIDEIYTLPHGKYVDYRNHATERVFTFSNPEGSKMQIVIRAYDDAIAFRYRFPEVRKSPARILKEETGFRVPGSSAAYLAPHDKPSKYTPAYETYYSKGVAAGTASPSPAGWSFPALFKETGGNNWILISEAGLAKNYVGSRLDADCSNNLYRIRFPDEGEGNGVGDPNPTITLPWSSPWRFLVVGRSPGAMVESNHVTHLSNPTHIEDTSWIQPGRVAWSWWSQQDSPKNFNAMLPFIDLASNMGWEYFLVDANWDEMGDGAIERLVDYAEKRNVGILLWYNSGGPHNTVTEKPRDRVYDPETRRREFTWMKRIGVRGAKIDFFQSDKSDSINLYLDILKDAAEFELMVNFHGCTIPRGWRRTYPNLMTMEAVRGAECYIFDPSYPESAPWYNTILPFTRNAIGPMDYTPVAFSDNTYPHLTTFGHELALSIVFESAWTHFADSVSSYRQLPESARGFLRDLPVAWDETRYVEGEPGIYVVLARRKDHVWYLAGINGEGSPRELHLQLPFLDQARYAANLISDGKSGKELRETVQEMARDQELRLEMKAFGGFAAKLESVR